MFGNLLHNYGFMKVINEEKIEGKDGEKDQE